MEELGEVTGILWVITMLLSSLRPSWRILTREEPGLR